jgi:inositol polyphosphate-4-phosphatase
VEGNGYCVRVIIPVLPSNYFPENYSLECSITGLFFNIGVNEQATLAETFGQVKAQDEINKKSFFKLENFITNQAVFEQDSNSTELVDELAALRNELYSQRAKNIRVLMLMERICANVGGIRFTSCKSAKDRTGMAVTLEEARAAFEFCALSELDNSSLFQQMLDTLRSEGVRRENTRKNVGVAKYAFNSLQIMTLPKLLRPPPGTYGYVQS